jgi:NADH-quinone oxidoreductase subunit C
MSTVDAAAIAAIVNAAVPGADVQAVTGDQPGILVSRDRLHDVARVLHAHADLQFTLLSDVTAVDYLPRDPRFELIYHLAAIELPTPGRLRMKVPVPNDSAHAPTVSDIWPAAGWLEREVWDLFGIAFDNHTDLRRVLMPEDWEGHPLRKDYPVQIKLTPKVYAPLQLTEQEFEANLAADRHVRTGKGKGDPGRTAR